MTTAVIFVGGEPPPSTVVAMLPNDRFVIAADSGYDHARALGVAVDLLVGDLDSISDAGLTHARDAGVVIERHPPDKDATDTELAIGAALAHNHRCIVGVAGGGDRLDHELGTLGAFAHPRLDALTVMLWWGTARITVLRSGVAVHFDDPPETTFSLLPIHGGATVGSMSAVRYPLTDAELVPGSTLGISNIATGPVDLAITEGTVLHIVPFALATDAAPAVSSNLPAATTDPAITTNSAAATNPAIAANPAITTNRDVNVIGASS